MEAYREVQRVSIPPAVAARRLADVLGDDGTAAGATGESSSDGRQTWRYTRLGGLYTYEVALDPAAGEVTTVVAVPDAVRICALSALVVVPLLVLLEVPTTVLLAGLWGYALLALLPAAHLWPGLDSRPDLDRIASTVSRQSTVAGLPAYAGAIGCLWAALRPQYPAMVIDLASGLLLVVGAGIFYAGNAFTGEESPGITAVGIPLSGLLPALFTTGNLVLASVLLDDSSVPLAVVATILVVALGFDAAFVVYCRAVLDSFRDARLESLRSPLARVAGLGLYLGVNLVLLVALGVAVLALGAWAVPQLVPPVELPVLGVVPLSGRLAAVFTPLPGPAWAYATGFAAVLVLPMLATAVMWATDVVTGITARHALLSAAEPVDIAVPTAPETSVLVVDHDRPFVRPVSVAFGRRQHALVSQPVLDLLDERERAAVLAHEAYHLEHRDLTVRAAATLAAVAFGGRNSLLAFYDLAGAERRADEFAADRVGTDPLVRALRQLEDERAGPDPTARVDRQSTTAAQAGTRPASSHVRETLRAPYELFFGSVLFERAHRSVDERVAHLLGRGDDEGQAPSDTVSIAADAAGE